MDSSDALIHQIQERIKREIFRPVFMNFPFLDRLGLPSRKRAQWLAAHFTDQLVLALENATKDITTSDCQKNDLPKSLMAARLSGKLNERQFRDNITVPFVAGQENPQLAIISTLYLLAKNPVSERLWKHTVLIVNAGRQPYGLKRIQDELHDEILLNSGDEISHEVLQAMPWLTAVVYESLRLFPPIGQLINRCVSQPIRLGGDIFIPEGSYVGYNSYSTNRDPEAWGADADSFRPSRWGQSCQDIQREYRRRRARAEFISFHGGQRACFGERFALLQLKTTLYVLVKSLRWRLDPAWPDRMTPAGPLCPRNLRLIFEQRPAN